MGDKSPMPNNNNNGPVRVARKRLGLSQLALATRAGLCLNTVSLAERSGRMTPQVAERLAAALNIDVAALTCDQEPE